MCLTPVHFHLMRHQSFPHRLRHPTLGSCNPIPIRSRISLSAHASDLVVFSDLTLSNLRSCRCCLPRISLFLSKTSFTVEFMSSSNSVLVHFALVISRRLCPAWPILPASRLARRHLVLVRRHPRPACARHPSRLYTMQLLRHLIPISATSSRSPMRKPFFSFAQSFSNSRCLIHCEFEGVLTNM